MINSRSLFLNVRLLLQEIVWIKALCNALWADLPTYKIVPSQEFDAIKWRISRYDKKDFSDEERDKIKAALHQAYKTASDMIFNTKQLRGK